IAHLILSAAILTPCASWIALRNRGLPSASPPPIHAAIVISLMSLVNMRPRLASMAPFLCLMLCHLEWPDINYSFNLCRLSASVYHRPVGQGESHKKAQKTQILLCFLCLFVATSSYRIGARSIFIE